MNKNVKKLTKTCVIGGALYLACQFGYDMGKGAMLGTLLQCDAKPEEALKIISTLKDTRLSVVERLRLEFISYIASIRAKREP